MSTRVVAPAATGGVVFQTSDIPSAIFKLYLQLRVKYGHNGPTYVKF
jgi:hypothetical protein